MTPEGSGAPGGYRLPPSSRVRQRRDILNLLKRGKRTRTASLDVFVTPSPASRPRYGLVVPKHRHRIVDRNRLKRRLRELGRTEVLPRLHRAGMEVDLLVRARREAYARTYDGLKDELERFTETLCSSGSS